MHEPAGNRETRCLSPHLIPSYGPMKSQATFRSDFFQPIPGEDSQTNPGIYGKALAHWLAEQLRARGVTIEEVIAEDWGWLIMVSRKPFLLWIGCGSVDESAGEWRVFVEAEPSVIQRLFKGVNTGPAIAELQQHLEAIVPAIPKVSEIVWE